MNRSPLSILTLLTALGLGLSLGPLLRQETTSSSLTSARAMSNAFQEVSLAVSPSVVSLQTFARSSRRGQFRRRYLAQGSGVIVRPDGILITNNHVVQGADEIAAYLPDGREFVATIVGTDPDTDLAVLRIKGDGFPVAPIEEEMPEVGEWVLAMGNPFGIGHTVTAGIVSGKGRMDLDIAFYEDFIQTDAAINPGNSGGPLIDLDGHVVGINTAIGTRADGSQGIGFAIPSGMVNRVLRDLLKYGTVKRGWLGVEHRGFNLAEAREQGFTGKSRVAVKTLVPNSPAERAGMRVGDVIVSLANRPIVQWQGMLNTVADLEPGLKTTIQVWREGKTLSLPVTLQERE